MVNIYFVPQGNNTGSGGSSASGGVLPVEQTTLPPRNRLYNKDTRTKEDINGTNSRTEFLRPRPQLDASRVVIAPIQIIAIPNNQIIART